MKLKHQIFIDKYIGSPIARLSNLFIRLLGKLLRLDHSLDRSFKTIAVAKYKGLGSVVQSTPLLQTLRQHYKDAHIIFVTTSGNKMLVEKLDCVDEVLILNDKGVVNTIGSLFRLLLLLWKRKVGVFLDLETYSNTSSLITSFSLARNRMGYYLRSSNYRMGMYTHMMFYNIQSPVSETYLQFARLLGCEQLTSSLCSLRGKGQPFSGLHGDYMVVNVNASDLRIERRWPMQRFIELINDLTVNYPAYSIVLIGNEKEKPYVDELVDQLKTPSKVMNLAGKTNFDELLGIIEHTKLMITNDTGPMHLGFALNTPMVALFGPCSPEQYGGKTALVLYKKVYCSPCVHEFEKPPCNGNNQCMKLITVTEVLTAIRRQLQEGSIPLSAEDNQQKQVVYHLKSAKGRKFVLGMVNR